MKIVIGVDPDTKLHGCAFYADGRLLELASMSRIELVKRALSYREKGFDVLFSIEDVAKNKGVFGANKAPNKMAASGMGYRIGMLARCMTEILDDLNDRGFEYRLHKISSDWKKTSEIPLFKAATGWSGSSSKDKRSAAWFGWIECK